MKNWVFLIFQKGRLLNQGVIVDEVSDGHWLCYLSMGGAPFGQIFTASQMLTWHLFPDDEERQRFLQNAVNQEPAAVLTEDEGAIDFPEEDEDDESGT